MSNLMTTFGPTLVLSLISVIISWVSNTFSIMLLPFTKPDCSSEMRFGRRPTKLSWITLEKILLTKLLKLIGRISENVFTSFLFGNSTRFVCVTNLGSSWPQKNALTIWKMSSPIISQHLWKKHPVRPSGPPTLSLFKPKTACFTSSLVGVVSKPMFCSLLTIWGTLSIIPKVSGTLPSWNWLLKFLTASSAISGTFLI